MPESQGPTDKHINRPLDPDDPKGEKIAWSGKKGSLSKVVDNMKPASESTRRPGGFLDRLRDTSPVNEGVASG